MCGFCLATDHASLVSIVQATVASSNVAMPAAKSFLLGLALAAVLGASALYNRILYDIT